MNRVDWIGFFGVTILLVAFFLNLKDVIEKDGSMYLWLNFIGAGVACFASFLLSYWPFIVLEGCWTMVSLMGLIAFYRSKE